MAARRAVAAGAAKPGWWGPRPKDGTDSKRLWNLQGIWVGPSGNVLTKNQYGVAELCTAGDNVVVLGENTYEGNAVGETLLCSGEGG